MQTIHKSRATCAIVCKTFFIMLSKETIPEHLLLWAALQK